MAVSIIITVMMAFLVALLTCPFFIKVMKRLQFGQQIRDDGPSHHSLKAGTPTMGGLVILFSTFPVVLIMAGSSTLLGLIFMVAIGCGIIGFFDDYLKVTRSRSLGLKARSKLAGEILLSLLLILLLRFFGFYSPLVVLPVLNLTINLGPLYPVLVFLLITGFSNSVNLTDGIDGLAAGVSVISLSAYIIIASLAGFPGTAFFSAALAGACLGFLVFNRHPARIFMGDVGSLALGGSFAAIAILTKTELILLIVGAVFVLEAFSVIFQVIGFRLTGRRLFLMSPLHHHFELKGWSEWRVVTNFWAAALVFAVAGTLAYSRLVWRL